MTTELEEQFEEFHSTVMPGWVLRLTYRRFDGTLPGTRAGDWYCYQMTSTHVIDEEDWMPFEPHDSDIVRPD